MKMKKIVTWGLAMGLMASSLFGTSIYAASAGSRKINDTYGTIRGEIEGGKNARSNCFAVESKVSKKVVPRLMAGIEVYRYSTGKYIGAETSGWQRNSKRAGCDIDMAHFGNKGYVSIKCTAYGTHEAIIKKAYTVYTSTIY